MSEKLITNSVEAKELLLGAATALESGVNRWCESDVAKIRYLAEQIEIDLHANEDFELLNETFNEVLLNSVEEHNELIELKQNFKALHDDLDVLLVGLIKWREKHSWHDTPIYNRPHEFHSIKGDECSICDRHKSDTIHAKLTR